MSLNRVLLIGRLGADPELRYTPTQVPVCNLRIATNERRRTPEGEWVDETEWHSVATFGKTAENCSKFLSKGREVFVEGRLRTHKWQDQEGKDRYKTEILASGVRFIGGRGADTGFGSSDRTPPMEQGTPSGKSGPSAGDTFTETVSFDDDDLPF